VVKRLGAVAVYLLISNLTKKCPLLPLIDTRNLG